MQQYVEIIHDQGERLAGLIEGFLAAEERNGGGMELDTKPVDVGELVHREVDLIAADSPDHELSVEVDAGHLVALADGERVAQVVINLLTNAVKYSPAGGRIRVRVHRQGGSIVTSVQDEGLGIPAETKRACSASSSAARPGRAASRASASGLRCRARSSRRTAAASTSRARRTRARRSGSNCPYWNPRKPGIPQKGYPGSRGSRSRADVLPMSSENRGSMLIKRRRRRILAFVAPIALGAVVAVAVGGNGHATAGGGFVKADGKPRKDIKHDKSAPLRTITPKLAHKGKQTRAEHRFFTKVKPTQNEPVQQTASPASA